MENDKNYYNRVLRVYKIKESDVCRLLDVVGEHCFKYNTFSTFAKVYSYFFINPETELDRFVSFFSRFLQKSQIEKIINDINYFKNKYHKPYIYFYISRYHGEYFKLILHINKDNIMFKSNETLDFDTFESKYIKHWKNVVREKFVE